LCPVPCGVSLWIFFQYIRDFSKFFRACPHHLINLGDLLIWTVELMFAICILKQLGCVHPWLLGEEEPAENCKGISSRRQFVSRSCWWVLHCGVSVIKLHSCFVLVLSSIFLHYVQIFWFVEPKRAPSQVDSSIFVAFRWKYLLLAACAREVHDWMCSKTYASVLNKVLCLSDFIYASLIFLHFEEHN
jgi:hypothetical protein